MPFRTTGIAMFRYLKELLLVIYLLLYSEYYIERLNAIGVGFAVLLFGAMFLALTLALYLTAYIRQALIRHLFAITLFASAVFFDVYTRVTADYLSYSSFVSLVYSGGFIQEAAYQYRDAIIHGALSGLLLLFGIGLKPRHALVVPNALRVAAPVCGVLLLSAVLFLRAGEGARGLPIMYTPLAYLNLFTYEALHNTVGPREPVTLARSAATVNHDIVLIIDESISGNYLDINAPFGVHSNLKQAHPGSRFSTTATPRPLPTAAPIPTLRCATAVRVPTTYGSTARCRRSGSTRKRPGCARCTSTPSAPPAICRT
jgi:hypothetical protein